MEPSCPEAHGLALKPRIDEGEAQARRGVCGREMFNQYDALTIENNSRSWREASVSNGCRLRLDLLRSFASPCSEQSPGHLRQKLAYASCTYPSNQTKAMQHLVFSRDDAMLRSQSSFEGMQSDALYESSAMVVQSFSSQYCQHVCSISGRSSPPSSEELRVSA